jgi:hypothetical protein
MSDERHYAPATLRNREPILAVLRPVLPPRGVVLEIASGSGEHVAFLAQQLPDLTFQPTDPDSRALKSIAAWRAATGAANLRAPLALDAANDVWPIESADAILCINMVHISPWASTLGLLRGAAKLLPVGAPLFLYGPYIRAGVETSPSNLEFDADLRRRNAAWGLRDLADVTEAAERAGFSGPTVTEMPANNLSVVFRRS